MDQQRSSIWERLAWEQTFDIRAGDTPRERREFRRRERLAGFADETRDTPWRVEECKRRRQFWDRELGQKTKSQQALVGLIRGAFSPVWLMQHIKLPVVGFFAVVLALSLVSPLLAILLFAIAFVALRVTVARQHGARSRTRWCLQTLRCPNCGYPLAETPSDPAIGPEACPECGSPWPLVPPPTSFG